jgi:hypothetical protein
MQTELLAMLMNREELILPYIRAHPDKEVAERMSCSVLSNGDQHSVLPLPR